MVVAIVTRTGSLVCSATLIAPQIVLTAAHCGLTSINYYQHQVFVGETVGSPGELLEVVDARTHPEFDAQTFANDLTLLYLHEPASVLPAQLLTQPPPAVVGTPVQVVGYGMTHAGATDYGTRRQGTAALAELSDRDFELVPSPSQPCSYDSGGAGFLVVDGVKHLAGVVSRGDTGCASYARLTRVDVALDFIHGYVAEIAAEQRALGERCFDDAHCQSGSCWSPPDEPRARYCSRPCTGDAECDGLVCATTGDGTSRCQHPLPSPYAPGATCVDHTDCIDAPCLERPDQPSVCARSCSPSTATCPDGFVCTRVGTIQHACLAPTTEPPPPGPSGGCAVGYGASSPWWGSIALLLAVARRRLRVGVRRRHTFPPGTRGL